MKTDCGVEVPESTNIGLSIDSETEDEIEGRLVGHMTAPAPSGLLMFFNLKGILDFHICSIVEGCMT